MSKKWYIVSYDIRDPKRLKKVSKVLLGFGTRIQMSVYRCRLTSNDLERMYWELVMMISEKDDLLIVGICDRCASQIRDSSGRMDWIQRTGNTFKIV